MCFQYRFQGRKRAILNLKGLFKGCNLFLFQFEFYFHHLKTPKNTFGSGIQHHINPEILYVFVIFIIATFL